MFFEEALACMRSGKAVIFDGRSYPLCITDNRICELTSHGLEPLDSMNTCNMMRNDWHIFDIVVNAKSLKETNKRIP